MLAAVLAAAILPPVWPLGANPVPGAPYIIINKKVNELAYINEGKIQMIYRVATGSDDDMTPEGEFTITVKARDPFYRKHNIAGNDPDNPLGSRWIGFDAMDTDGRTYGIHGNNDPDSIGKYVSQGCIRMYEDEVQALFEEVPPGTKVLVVASEKDFYELAVEHGAVYPEDAAR
ncbi:L,D-transpeptidase [Bacillus marinisedimentorum]|uniref:L,D-transpeptidase n=1 Tax=Bacillus marinisedimentorum TaxID=1821260 RepID=UPI00087286CD|nr:L,D-transpeptidase [Bacillus marinisedimentorum]